MAFNFKSSLGVPRVGSWLSPLLCSSPKGTWRRRVCQLKDPTKTPLRPFRLCQELTCDCWSCLVSFTFLTSGNGEEQRVGGHVGNRRALWLESETGQEQWLQQEDAETHTQMTHVLTHPALSLVHSCTQQWEAARARKAVLSQA